jgi:hypothetical protein
MLPSERGSPAKPPSNYDPRWGRYPGAAMLACRKLGELRQTKHYYLGIPSRSCYCVPMFCVLAPEARIFDLLLPETHRGRPPTP